MVTDLGHAAFACHVQIDQHQRAVRVVEPEALSDAQPGVELEGLLQVVAGDRFIEVFPGGPAPDSSPKGSFMHLCLLTDDLSGTVAQLRAAGVEITHGPSVEITHGPSVEITHGPSVEITHGPSVGLDHNAQAWIADPDGNPIELMQLAEHSPQRRVARGEAVTGL